MQIQISTDHNIDGSEGMHEHFKETLSHTLARFDDHITSLQVHLKDQNGNKEGGDDKTCTIEARVKGSNPASASHTSDTLQKSVKAAAEKIKSILDKTLEQKHGR